MENFLIKLLEPRTNGPEITEKLISLLNIKISHTTLTKEIEEHPNYPSLLSISDILNNYGIENIGIKFDITKMASLPVPFVTQLEGLQSSILFFTVVRKITDKSILLWEAEKHKWIELSFEEFKDRCSRVALLVEARENAGEPDYKIKRKEEKKKTMVSYAKIFSIPAIVVLGILIAFANQGLNALLPIVYCLVTLIGTGISALLLFYELDIHNPLLQQICSSGKKVNCGTVLRSKGSKIFGISWSAIGFSYFMGTLLLLLASGISNPQTLYMISWINSIVVFYFMFSIYYQWRVAKQWCILCLGVQAVLVLQLIIGVDGNWHHLSNFYNAISYLILPLLTSFTIPFVATAILMPTLKKAKQSKGNFNALQKLKHNKQVFETLLTKQKHLKENPDGLGILLGSDNASHKLIKVCNPYCAPCSKAHKPMEELLDNNTDLQIRILFTASNKDGDIKAPPVKHLLAIAEKKNEALTKKALEDWYLSKAKDYESFALRYPMNGELNNQASKIDEMKKWCDDAVISYTPMFFVSLKNSEDGTVNYYQLPEIYSVADLKYFFSK